MSKCILLRSQTLNFKKTWIKLYTMNDDDYKILRVNICYLVKNPMINWYIIDTRTHHTSWKSCRLFWPKNVPNRYQIVEFMRAQPVGTSFPQITPMGPISMFSLFVSCLVGSRQSCQSCSIFVDRWQASITQWIDNLKMKKRKSCHYISTPSKVNHIHNITSVKKKSWSIYQLIQFFLV